MLKNRLIKLRTGKGLSQYDLAKTLNLSRGQISNYELGSRQPDYETLTKIADFFNVSTDYLLCRTNDPSPKGDLHAQLSPEIYRLLDTARDLTPDQTNALNLFVKAMAVGTNTRGFDIDAHNEEARRTFRKALADEPDLLNFWLEQEDRENLQLFMSQAKTLEPEDIKDIVRKIKQVEDEEAAEY